MKEQVMTLEDLIGMMLAGEGLQKNKPVLRIPSLDKGFIKPKEKRTTFANTDKKLPELNYGYLVKVEGNFYKVTEDVKGMKYLYFKEAGENPFVAPINESVANEIVEVYAPNNVLAIHSYNPENFKKIWQKEEQKPLVLTLEDIKKKFNIPADKVVVVEGK